MDRSPLRGPCVFDFDCTELAGEALHENPKESEILAGSLTPETTGHKLAVEGEMRFRPASKYVEVASIINIGLAGEGT